MKRSGPIQRKTPLARKTEMRRDTPGARRFADARTPLARTPLAQGTSTLKRTGIKRKPRSQAETERIYGTPERRDFATSRPCCVCTHLGQRQTTRTQQAHVGSHVEAGMGRKGDADTIADLCAEHHAGQEGRATAFERDMGLPDGFLLAAAARLEAEWQAHRATL